VIAEVIVCKPVDATEGCGLSARIPQRPKPFAERVLVIGSDVVEDFHVIFAYKRIIVKKPTVRNPLTISVYAWNNKRQSGVCLRHAPCYVAKLDDSYTFEHVATESQFLYTTFFLSMTSQQWRDDNSGRDARTMAMRENFTRA
jgi:hypothetical protein